MTVLQVVSSRERAGKSAIAVGFARGLAGQGRVRLVRTGTGEPAAADAVSFGSYLFAATPGVVVDAPALAGFSADETVIVEADAGSIPMADVATLIVVRREASDEDKALAEALGDRLVGTFATDVLSSRIEAVARDLTNAGLRPLAILPEDARLAAPSVGEIRDILNAQVLYEGENEHEVVEDVLVSPVYSDPASPHFRRFESKAVLAPFNKPDLHLAVIDTRAACLVITGGRDPSPYVADRAQGESTTVLLAPNETPETLSQLSDVWLTSRFRGDRKAEAIHELLESRFDIPSILRKL